MRSLNSDTQIAHEQERQVNTVKHWREKTVERLGITHEELEAAILRGWGGDLIDEVMAADVDRLQGTPMDPVITEALKRVKVAPVERITPTFIRSKSTPRSPRYEQPKPKNDGVSVMELAFMKATE